MIKKKTLFIIAGHSGGHILPALVLGKKWKYDNNDGQIIFFSGAKNIDGNILNQEQNLNKKISLRLINFPNKKFWLYPQFIFQLIWISIKSFYYLIKFRPKKIITTGGYLSIPICILSKIFGPIVHCYELNVIPGKAIKFLAPFVDKLFIVFEQTKKYFKQNKKIELKNYPLRYSQNDKIFDKELLIQKINKEKNVNFDFDKKTIFLLGGSQGSLYLNNYLKQWLEKNKNVLHSLQIIHQIGGQDKTDWNSFYKDLNLSAVIFSYEQDLKDYYLLSDLVICRAGAGTLFELEFFKKKSLIIPLKTSYTSHQIDNAELMIKRNPDLFFKEDLDFIL